MSSLSKLVSALNSLMSQIRLPLRGRNLLLQCASVLTVLCLLVTVARRGGSAAMIQVPALLALLGCIAAGRPFFLRSLGARVSASLTGCRREAALLQRLQTLCSSGDFPQRHERVADLVAFLAAQTGCSRFEQKQLAAASGLHNIGLVSLPPGFAGGPGATARQAAMLARRLLSGSSVVHRLAIEMASCQSENWDGTGEAFGLANDAIPFSARLLHVALALDALLPRTGRLPDRSELVSIAARLDAEGGRTLDPALAHLSSLHIDALELLLRSHLGRHIPCGIQPQWWSYATQPYVVGRGLTVA
ncbi:hypothetical protein NFI95_13730 [Acetobacteraceae bacterium KSS8]|uniref:HD-GYP domain-containing protein n=1 Tax=Endosaccharibacter trunci TaxID=2812733 RepID=A0ABT1W9D2_9PROT|nr:hypothetical protein [Acetobacteraceae bacterium KSS8]